MENLAQEIHKELYEHLMPFWNSLIDLENGGFYGEVTYDLEVIKASDKGGIATARLLWTYSRLYRYEQDAALLPYMHHLYEFLTGKLMDATHKGVYWLVDYRGLPTDTRKHIYAQGFALYALAEYYRVTGHAEALDFAKDLFELIETTGYDRKHEGYMEEFTEAWQLKDNEMLSENGITAYFTMNTYLHILEAYTNLYRVWQNEALKSSLVGLIMSFRERFFDAGKGVLRVFLNESWENLVEMNSYGHDIEATWLIQDAMDVLDLEDESIQSMILSLGEGVFRRGIHEDGSLINECVQGKTDETRVWWAQSEAMVGFLNLYKQTGDTKYMTAVQGLWRHIKERIIDDRAGGEWFWSVEADGQPTQHSIVGPWKTPYHNVRGCVEVLERLTQV